MFQFPAYAFRTLFDSHADARLFVPGGFPHSDICGSKTICVSPQLFAACRVLHRLLVPGHSPCALNSLTLVLSFFLMLEVIFLARLV
jgi:hypothetical protein